MGAAGEKQGPIRWLLQESKWEMDDGGPDQGRRIQEGDGMRW